MVCAGARALKCASSSVCICVYCMCNYIPLWGFGVSNRTSVVALVVAIIVVLVLVLVLVLVRSATSSCFKRCRSFSLYTTFMSVQAVSKSAIASYTGIFLFWRSFCPGGSPHGLGISSLFKPGYFQREVMDGVLEDRDGLGVDLCLGRRLGPLLQNARASEGAKLEQPTRQWRSLRRVK